MDPSLQLHRGTVAATVAAALVAVLVIGAGALWVAADGEPEDRTAVGATTETSPAESAAPQRILEGERLRPAPDAASDAAPEAASDAGPSPEPGARGLRRQADRAAAQESDNPFAARAWANYQGPADLAHPPYAAATGATKDLLGRIALTPKAMWFGAWMPNDQIADRITEYIADAQGGDPEALVQMTVFRLQPWYTEACQRAPSAAEQASYRDWIDRAAAAIGDTPTAIVLQPDLTFALCAPDGPAGVATQLVDYAAEAFAGLPETSVYIEAGSSAWPHVGQGGVEKVMEYLVPAGIEHARGFALNSTHFSATPNEVQRVADIADALAARGMPGKKGVVNTSSNGNPFDFGDYRGSGENTIADNARVCTTPAPAPGDTCAMLGIPPTADVDDPRWGLGEETGALAREHVDAYLWFGRPWLFWQNSPYQTERALPLAQHWPFAEAAGF